ncbi:hypothetical protein [Chryseobacterium sp. JUb7]|uniref:hypothetical protein n=1 Tax=Chryseobacterium sp. JUb7 TaxID=2940599 RepID=UPI002167C74B|nr:hypothetical protein [Chryseobacterium sp. JUb7]MCS3530236.1 hypothetical protein [Chryseobacterium sp. JUb7]
MKKIFLFLLFAVGLSAQKTETIELKQNIKDRNSRTKSLTLIDNRTDKEIGKVSDKKEITEVKLPTDDLNTFVQNWFADDNKTKGNNDIVLVLEELKVYDEQAPNDKFMFGKAKLKISSFIKRKDRYYFINRFDNVIVCDPKRVAHVSRYLSQNISDAVAQFVNASYTNSVVSQYIPENEISNYDSYLGKNNKSLQQELKDGVYLNFKNFSDQEPAFGYYIEKNKKGRVVRLKQKEETLSLSEVFCYVEAGKAYRFTPVGFLEMIKDDKGFYIISARTELFAETKSGGIVIGAIAGGLVGAAIGAAIESGSNKGAMNGFGFRSSTYTNVYIDSLTGSFNFQQ